MLILKHHSNRSEYSLCLQAAMNHHDSVFHQTASSLCSIQEKIIEVQFSSECKVRVFANCSKNQNKVRRASSNPVGCLASPNTGDFARKKSPTGGEYKNFEMQNSLSPHISPGSPPPLGEADDKCIIV